MKYLFAILLMLCLASTSHATELANDTFNRADGGLGAGWTSTTGFGNPTIATNVVQPAAAGGSGSMATIAGVSFGNDQYASVKLVSLITSTGRVVGIVLRGITTARTQYECQALGPIGSTTTLRILRYNTGTPTTLATTAADQTVAANDIMKCEIIGSTPVLYINGVAKVAPGVDGSPIASGTPGINLFSSGAATDVKIDDFLAGETTSSAAAQSSQGFLGVIIK